MCIWIQARYFWKISFLLVAISLFACRAASVKKREELAILDKIVEVHSQIMFEKYGFVKSSYCTYNGDGGVFAVSVDMKILGPKDYLMRGKLF
ncbi:hypothetical protein [Criblamydia sequanensis]|uniref:Membrane protein n=1 Tax=Candidatus Criblamydia sequanensis CRIB-18 TaxID=1437425 RepID=A0A090D2K6_9BACT|nr:hypothetical protein [Criblamydia sequanensis]CDR34710.1 Putative membrane protein [Criblamydia sequanensis CRIB-18]